MVGWDIVRTTGDARAFHALGVPEGARRSVRVLGVDAPALALGSSQSLDDVDMEAARRLGVDVFARSSGGGAVLLHPGAQVWIDVVLGRSDPLWLDDVGRAAHWLGDVWSEALGAIGIHGVVHTGAMVTTAVSPVVCFAGLASGEITVGGAKVLGVSQRRTRAGARFQCSVPLVWDAPRHAQLLAPGLRSAGGAIDEVRVHTVDPASADALVDAFCAALP